MSACPGEGRRWIGGTGSPICPVCHRGVTTLTGKKPRNNVTFIRNDRNRVPAHERRTS